MDIVIMWRIFGARAGENVMYLMPHLGELIPQTKYVMIYAAWESIVIRRNLYDFHLTIAALRPSGIIRFVIYGFSSMQSFSFLPQREPWVELFSRQL